MLLNLKKDNLKILDYGAGKGRTYFEIKKDNIPFKIPNIEYHFWEPYLELQNELSEKIQTEKTNVKVIKSLEDINYGYYDVVLLTNVVHECNPDDFSKILKHTSKILNKDGLLIIIELDPLITAEKFAVSYSEDDMTDILDMSGWRPNIPERINVTNKLITAYWIAASKKNIDNIKTDEIKKNIISQWSKIKTKYARTYELIDNVKSLNNFNKTLNSLTILASMISYSEKRWDNFLNDDFYNKLDTM